MWNVWYLRVVAIAVVFAASDSGDVGRWLCIVVAALGDSSGYGDLTPILLPAGFLCPSPP